MESCFPRNAWRDREPLPQSEVDRDWTKKYGSKISLERLMISSGIYAGELCSREKYEYLRSEFPNTLVTVFVMDEEEIPVALKKDYVFVSTNAADGPHYERVGHPETAGTFPHLIREYVLDKNVLSLSEAVKKISLLPARRFGIENKGSLRPGHDADIVIIDPRTIYDRADFVNHGDPNAPPEGVSYVLVNGKVILKDNVLQSVESAGSMINSHEGK